jgi:replication factor A1
MAGLVSKGVIGKLNSATTGETNSEEMSLQVNAIKPMEIGGMRRFRFTLTDGADTIFAMGGASIGAQVTNGEVKENSVIRITQWMINNVNGQRLLIIMGADVIQLDAPPIMTAEAASMSLASQAPSVIQQKPAPVQGGGVSAVGGSYSSYANSSYGSLNNSYNGAPGGSSVNQQPVMANNNANLIPISALNPYSNRFSFKARITNKADKRSWNNANGQGTLFSIDLLDEHGGEIRATMFKETCEKFFPVLQADKVYIFSGGKLKVASKQYNKCNNQYEITFDNNTIITEAADDNKISKQQFNFVKISALETAEVKSTVDVIGFVKDVSDVQTIISKNQGGREIFKKDLTLQDETGYSIRVTLWGEKATSEEYPWFQKPIVGLKNVQVGDYNGVNLSCGGGSTIVVEPDCDEARTLFSWLKDTVTANNGELPAASSLSAAGGSGKDYDSIENRKMCIEIKENQLGHGEKPDWSDMKLHVTFIPTNRDPWYEACPNPDCKKKVVEEMNSTWRCEKCNQSFDNCKRRYIMSAQCADSSGADWFSLFDEQAQEIFGMTADELKGIKDNQGEEHFNDVLQRAYFRPYIFKSKHLVDNTQDVSSVNVRRVKNTVSKLCKVDYVSESHKMLGALLKYENEPVAAV